MGQCLITRKNFVGGGITFNLPNNKVSAYSESIRSGAKGISYLFVVYAINDGRVSVKMVLQGSNDNSNWNDIENVSRTGGGMVSTKINTNNSYKYYRMFAQGGNMGVNNGWAWAIGCIYTL